MPDGTLLLSVGDGGNPPVEINGGLARLQSKNLNSHIGKVLRLRDDDGTAPPDNPFVGRPNAKPEVFTAGHRHVQGLARHRTAGCSPPSTARSAATS